jgi:glycosyltransferase involved in cell wall biosynthesis
VQLRTIPPGSSVGAGRGDAVVCVAADGAGEECLTRVLAHTPGEVPILLCGDRDGGLPEVPARAGEVLHLPVARAAAVNTALSVSAPADVIVVRAGCLVAGGWYEGLRAAAYADGTVATASPLSDLGSFEDFDEAAAAVRTSSLRLSPRRPAAGEHCTYLRRDAIELIGGYEPARSFSERCRAAGLAHVAADQVLVHVPGGGGGDGGGEDSVEPDEYPGLARSVSNARRSLAGLTVLIDARVLTGPVNGSHVHALELIAALSRSGQARVTALLPSRVSDHARAVLESLPGVELTGTAGTARADIAHRPFQINSPADLNLLAQRADRLVITQQDLIGYHNPFYSPSIEGWQGYRELTRMALAVADRVVFFSAHARDDALAEELVEPHRASVVHIGVDHQVTAAGVDPVAPAGSERLGAGPERMLCLGTDYRHKNRLFALRLVSELQRRHGWDGALVLAGAPMRFGSSAGDEARMLREDPRLREAVVDFGAVSEAEKAWLLARVELVLYPTVHEGFGLVPFEAAEHGLPCLWAPGTSLSEILPDAAAGIVPWDTTAAAERALDLMRDERARAGNLEALRDAAAALRWDAAAARLIEVYRATCAEPATPAGAHERAAGLMRSGLSEDAMRLVGPGGLLPPRFERPLLALASHPRLGTPVFRAIEAGYRASRGWRRHEDRRR